jgi:Putative Ig domain
VALAAPPRIAGPGGGQVNPAPSFRIPFISTLVVAAVVAFGCGGGGNTGGNAGGGIPPLLITTSSLPSGLQDQAYNFTFQSTGGTAPYQWTVVSPNGLPAGIQLSIGGVLSGSTSSTGQYVTVYQVKDSSSPARSASISLPLQIIGRLTILSTTLPDITPSPNVGVRYNAQLNARGGVGTYLWSLLPGSGPLPPGITLGASNGFLSGVPTLAGTYPFSVQVDNSGPPQQTATQSYSLTITNDLTVLPFNGYFSAVVNKPYQTTLQVLGGQPPYAWSFVGKSQLAPGLSLDPSSGIITGSPTTVGSFQTAFQVTDSSSPQPQTVKADIFTIIVNKQLYFNDTTLPDAIAGRHYVAFFPVLGGIGPYVENVVAGSLPPGMFLQSSSNQISGVTNTAGASTFTIEVDDSETPPASIRQDFAVRVNPLLSFPRAVLPNALAGTPYSYTLQASGGLPPFHWSLSAFNPPQTWLSLDPLTGTIAGTPSQVLQNVFYVNVSDSSNPPQQAGDVASLYVLGKLHITTSTLPTVASATPLGMQIGADGGVGQYTWTTTSGQLPGGVTLDSTGSISGTTSQTGTFPFTVQVTDPGPPVQTSAPATLQLTVSANLGRNDSIATSTPLSNGVYRASISPYSDPPNGVGNPDSDYYKLTANPGAIVTIDGWSFRLTPPSPLEFVLEILDSNGNRLSNCATGKSTLGPFNQLCLSVANTNFNTPDPTLLVQVPSDAKSPMTFYAHALDYRGDARPDMLYELHIGTSFTQLSIFPTSITAVSAVGDSYQHQFSSSGGKGATTWLITSGTPPPGWLVNTSGLLSGVATAEGVYNFTVTAADQSDPPQTVQTQVTAQVAGPIVITSPAQWPDACVNQPYSFTAGATGGVPGYTWSFSSPAWVPITLDTARGIFSGTSNVTGTFHGVLGITDSLNTPGGQRSQNITLNVVACQ